MTAAKITLWSARILGAIIVAFVLFFLLARIFGNGEDGGPMSKEDMVTFTFFPLGLCIGLLLAYKWVGIGGLVATGSMVVLFILRTDLLASTYMLTIAFPGLLYLLHWWLKRREVT